MKSAIQLLSAIASCGLVAFLTFNSRAQGTAFTYQGNLNDGGSPAIGTYDLSFALFNASTGGTQFGATATTTLWIANGYFCTTLDFGTNFPGADRWLEIGVAPTGNPLVTLTPRQQLTPTPYAMTAANLTGPLQSAQLAGPYSSIVNFNNGADNFNGTFIGQFLGYSFIGGGFSGSFFGNGGGLIGLNAGALASGIVPAAQSGSLTNHSDVAAATLSPGQVLVYSGAGWTNAPLPGGPGANFPVPLAYSGGTNVPVNATLGNHFRLTATNSFTLQNPSGAIDAQRMTFEIVQDASGGHTMTFGNAFKFGTDLPVINLSTNAGVRDFITCICSGTNFYVVGFIKGF